MRGAGSRSPIPDPAGARPRRDEVGKTRKFDFDAKPGNYEDGAAKAAGLANAVRIGQINALK